MKIAGIIAEFNPFHNGHKYIIAQAKKITGADAVICIVSGPFTQKGDISIEDKFEKARIAVENGADMVIELPCIVSTSSASYFAFNAVKILNSMNMGYLCFGSETSDISLLENIAKVELENEKEIWSKISIELKKGITFSKARNNVLKDFLTSDEIKALSLPNNILGIEYIKALIKLKSDIKPIALQRINSSATEIRLMVKNGDESYKNYLPNNAKIQNPILNDKMFELVKYSIITMGKENLKNISEVTEGLENRIYDEVNKSKTYDELIMNIKSKRYELSKIKRIMVHILLNITKKDLEELTSSNYYIHILAISKEKKKELLSHLSLKSNLKTFSSINDKLLNNLDKVSQNSILLDLKAQKIYSLISKNDIIRDYTNMI